MRNQAADVAHAIVTNEGDYGFSLTSPQIPDLVAAYPDEATLLREFKRDITLAGFKSGQIVGHQQIRGQTAAGEEFLVRWQTDTRDGGQEDRVVVANHVLNILRDPEAGPELLDGLTPSATGEFIFVACLSADRLGWLIDQLYPRGDVLTACLAIADIAVASTQIATKDDLGWHELSDLGWSRETTLGEMVTRDRDRERILIS